jgi:hypothetical protein
LTGGDIRLTRSGDGDRLTGADARPSRSGDGCLAELPADSVNGAGGDTVRLIDVLWLEQGGGAADGGAAG